MSEQQRLRRLKKYEANEQSCKVPSQTQTNSTEVFSPFGPSILRFNLAEDLISFLNTFADKEIIEGKSCEFALPEPLVFAQPISLATVISNAIKAYVQESEGSRLKSVRFEIFWVVSQIENTPSPMHFHSGDISGVLYLKLPQISLQNEVERNYISGRKAGYINFIDGTKQRFSKSLISFKPRVGDLYIFPGWLLHGAEPFLGSGERRSIAFNAFIETE